MIIIMEQKSQELCQAIEHTNERQELLAAQMERMKILPRDAPENFQNLIFLEINEPEEQRLKAELDLLEKKHRLERLRKEWERARFLEGKELPAMECTATVVTGSSFRSFSPSALSVAPSANEEMLTL